MIKNILFDFDGVILDSMPIREFGFKKIFENFHPHDVEKLLLYHNRNGGLSRFVKIKYFFEHILKQDISEKDIQEYAEKFSVIMKKELIKKKYLIEDTVNFIVENKDNYNFHIVSGSEHNELNYLCEKLDLKKYFLDILGSPIPKNELVEKLLLHYKYNTNETILIGDSINDYDAAIVNNIRFYGYNNILLEDTSYVYLENYKKLAIKKNPYEDLDDKAFWKLAVADKEIFDVKDLWDPKFNIVNNEKIVTYGACFTQYFSEAFKNNKYNWISTEKAPFGLSTKNKHRFNYDVFSSRTGNIYTTSMLKQWVEWALDKKESPKEVWEDNGRFYDPFRPAIEPNGFLTEEEVLQSRQESINGFRESILQAKVFMFNLGLIESWHNKNDDYEYPICPGTAAGTFDDTKHIFKLQHFHEVNTNLIQAIEMMKEVNNSLKFIISISPVPITATNSNKHIIIANTETKSILRTVAISVTNKLKYVDYFPAFELVNSSNYKGIFFARNQRSITKHGVDFVMDVFFRSLNIKFKNKAYSKTTKNIKTTESKVVCEEEILNAFGGKNR